MDPNKTPNQIYGLPYAKMEYPGGNGGQGVQNTNTQQLQYSNMLQMMYGAQNVVPVGMSPQLYQYQAALAGLNVFPAPFGGQMGQTGGQLLAQNAFAGFAPGALGYPNHPFLVSGNGLGVVNPTPNDSSLHAGYGQPLSHYITAIQQMPRTKEDANEKERRNKSRDRDHQNKRQKDQGKGKEREHPNRDNLGRQGEHSNRGGGQLQQRTLSDSRTTVGQNQKYNNKTNDRNGELGGEQKGPQERRHREDRGSREREKSRIREGRDAGGHPAAVTTTSNHNYQQFGRRDDDRDRYRRDKDYRTSNGTRNEPEKYKDSHFQRDRERDYKRDYDRDRQADSWRQNDKVGDKPTDRERDKGGKDQRGRLSDREPAEKESGSLGFKVVTKPMDNIEGNTIPKDRPVSYMCIESNVARKAVVIEMVKFKIGKYFLEDKAVQARQAAEGEDELAVLDPEQECQVDDDELGLSDEEDLYHLTFRKRYYNDSEVCGACFKEGHTEKTCPERFRSVCWMCLGNHNKDECVNIACFRCNGSGHKNSICPMRDSTNFPFCQRCKKKSHLERDCSMLNLSFSRITQDPEVQHLLICAYCGLRGHLPSIHFKDQRMDVEIDHKLEMEPREPNTPTTGRVANDNEPQLDWQNDVHSEEGEEEALPSLYEPQESMQRENSTVLRMLSRESADKAGNPMPEDRPH